MKRNIQRMLSGRKVFSATRKQRNAFESLRKSFAIENFDTNAILYELIDAIRCGESEEEGSFTVVPTNEYQAEDNDGIVVTSNGDGTVELSSSLGYESYGDFKCKGIAKDKKAIKELKAIIEEFLANEE